jgi:antitoxin MazE
MYIHVYAISMTTKISKWGNSYGIRFPKEILEKFNLIEGSQIDIVDNEKTIEIIPKQKKASLSELLAQIPENTESPEIVDWGSDVGKEIIE